MTGTKRIVCVVIAVFLAGGAATLPLTKRTPHVPGQALRDAILTVRDFSRSAESPGLFGATYSRMLASLRQAAGMDTSLSAAEPGAAVQDTSSYTVACVAAQAPKTTREARPERVWAPVESPRTLTVPPPHPPPETA